MRKHKFTALMLATILLGLTGCHESRNNAHSTWTHFQGTCGGDILTEYVKEETLHRVTFTCIKGDSK